MIIKRLNEFTNVLSKTVITNTSGITYEHQTAYNLIRLAIKGLYKTNGTLYLIGNGGSNAIISHAAVDMMNKFYIKVCPITDSSQVTCFANDYENRNMYIVPLIQMLRDNDILIAVSSSGESKSIINAVKYTKGMGINVITFSGFGPDNPLRKLGNFNFYLDSTDYGIVETGHSFLLHLITDEVKDEKI